MTVDLRKKLYTVQPLSVASQFYILYHRTAGFVLMTRWREKRCDCPTLKHDEQDEDKQRKYYLQKKLLDPASVCADAELPASHSIQA